jgi:hypothetical protein
MGVKGREGKAGAKISPAFTQAIARALGGGEGGYELSSAFSEPELRKFHGEWEVTEHLVGGQPFLERFRARTARSLRAEGSSYRALYSFKEGLCTKRVFVEGIVDLSGREAEYDYRMAMALAWSIGPGGLLRVRPELGYHCSYLDGEPTAAGELAADEREFLEIRYRFADEELVLEEDEDVKRLRRRLGRRP